MKHRVFTFTFLLVSFSMFSQVDAPFYYMDFNQWWSEDANGCPGIDPIVGCEFYDWGEEMAHGNRISLTEIDPDSFGKSLKIRVQGGDHINVGGDTSKTRSEIAMHWGEHILYNNMARYYSYDMFIPNNSQFIESAGEWYNIFQWNCKQDRPGLCSDMRPPLLVQYVMPDGSEMDNKRDLKIRMGTYYGSSCTTNCGNDPHFNSSRTFIIKDAIELGVWNHMVFHIKWSYDEDDAFLKMNINNRHVVLDKVENGPCQGTTELRLGNPGEAPYSMDGVPLLYVDANAPNKHNPRQQDLIQNRLKIGHYRKGYSTDNRYFIDNFRITHAFPPAQFKNELIPWDCNVTLKDRDSYVLDAYELDPTNLYLFQFYDGVDYEYAGNSDDPQVDLLNQPWAKANKTYEVKVRSQNDLNNGWNGFPYGDMCTVTTPRHTQLEDEYCYNYNLTQTKVYCDPIIGATLYKFRIKKGGITYWHNTTNNWIDFADRHWFQQNVYYQVQVRAFTPEYPDGFGYGDQCNVRFIGMQPGGSNGDNAEDVLSASADYIQVFPNPSSGIVNVMSSEEGSTIQKISVLNSSGRLMATSDNGSSVDISHLPKGVYFLNVVINDENVFKRVVKE